MSPRWISRRELLATTGAGAIGACVGGAVAGAVGPTTTRVRRGEQRLSLEKLKQWESWRYGMFIHFGMSTFVQNELPDGKAPATVYAPDKLDVDQWVSVARDAGMKYIVLTAKHVAGHCLWPSKHTRYTVAHSGDKTDVCEAFVRACEKRGVRAGFYYCSWDNHNRFGSRTPSDPGTPWGKWPWGRYNFHDAGAAPPDPNDALPPYTTSVYQSFMTAQVTELLTQYGPIAETWIDIPGVLGAGFRTFLYRHIARLQPETIIMMNSGIATGETYDAEYAWPSDLIAIERRLPPEGGHNAWRTIAGQEYYLPGEVCDPIGKEWFWVGGDAPRSDAELAAQFAACRARGVNLLLDVPPDRHGVLPEEAVGALTRLRKNVGV